MVTIWLQIILYGVEVTLSGAPGALFLPRIMGNILHLTRDTEGSNNS